MLRILALGDVVGEEGVRLLENGGRLRRLIGERRADLTIVNGENSAEGNGMSRESAERLLDAGADVITGGNHTWRRRDVYRLLDEGECLIRPANYPPDAPGVGCVIAEARGYRVLVLNLIGTVYMEPVTPPADTAARILKSEQGKYDLAVCDFHAEATSEKLFLARYFDGKFAAVFGTHTHVQTSDEQVLPGGTGYITDLGMCGSTAGILGVRTESVIHKFTLRTPVQFEPAH
ncbi:MAG: YmdB family metallophosphoesterase, partial [Clostridia bacterium]|nr:YmdB family metallophosphoesterase [Clostridia bacterium]